MEETRIKADIVGSGVEMEGGVGMHNISINFDNGQIDCRRPCPSLSCDAHQSLKPLAPPFIVSTRNEFSDS